MDLSNRPAIGAVHAVQKDQSEPYEFSVAVLDAYQGEGLGTLLTAVVLVNCKALGIATLHAHALLENRSAISLLSNLGAELIETHSAVAEYRLDVAKALQELKKMERTHALECVLDRLEEHI